MALSVGMVGLNAEAALPYGTTEAVVFVLLPLPGLAAALLADRSAMRWPLGVLGAVYAAASVALFMIFFVYVGLLWMAAAGSFPRARSNRPRDGAR